MWYCYYALCIVCVFITLQFTRGFLVMTVKMNVSISCAVVLFGSDTFILLPVVLSVLSLQREMCVVSIGRIR